MVIYLTTNKINGKKYLGKDTQNNPKYLGSGLDIKKAIKKYGVENFEKTILEICDNQEELWKREEYWLNYYDAKNNKDFYNRTNKAFGAWEGRKYTTITKETKQKMSMAHKDIPLSTEHKKSISDAMIGHSKTEEWKQNLSKSCTESFGRKIIQKTLEGNIIKEWDSGKQAAQELNLNYTAINNCCRKNIKNTSRQRDKDKFGKYTSQSYIWEYKVL